MDLWDDKNVSDRSQVCYRKQWTKTTHDALGTSPYLFLLPVSCLINWQYVSSRKISYNMHANILLYIHETDMKSISKSHAIVHSFQWLTCFSKRIICYTIRHDSLGCTKCIICLKTCVRKKIRISQKWFYPRFQETAVTRVNKWTLEKQLT